MIAALKRYYDTLVRSSSDPTLYREVLDGKRTPGLAYLYWTLWLCSLFSAIAFAGWVLVVFPSVDEFTRNVERSTADLFPAALEVTIEKGQVRTNAREPVVIDLPREWTENIDLEDDRIRPRDGEFPHLIVIDTKASAEDFATLHTIALLTERSLVMTDRDDTLRIIPLQQVDDMVVNRAFYDEIRGGLLKLLSFLPLIVWTCGIILILILPFVAAAGWMLGYLLSLVVWVFLLWILNRWIGPRLSYFTLYCLSIRAITVVVGVDLLLQWTGFSFPFLSTMVFLGWMGYVLSTFETAPTATTPAPATPARKPARRIAKGGK